MLKKPSFNAVSTWTKVFLHDYLKQYFVEWDTFEVILYIYDRFQIQNAALP